MNNSYYDNLTSSEKGDLSDYRHASALYLRNNYRLTAKPKFLYHVVLNTNYQALRSLGSSVSSLLNKREFNLLVQSADLPNYTVDVATLNQYNRKRLNQTKINFDPIGINFHDDMAGQTTLLWEAYFRYYYQDPNYNQSDLRYSYSNNTYKGDTLNSFRYGLDKEHPVPFFDNIVINQLYSNNGNPSYTSYTLINPLIITMQHDTVDQNENSLAKSTIRFSYESVKYDRDYSGPDSPAGFQDPSHYDVTPSSLSVSDTAGLRRQRSTIDPFAKDVIESLFDYFTTNSLDTPQSPISTSNSSTPSSLGYDFGK